MNAAHQHPLFLAPRRLRQHRSPAFVGLVPNLAPVYRSQHDGFAAAQEHETMDLERIDNRPRGYGVEQGIT